MATNISIRLTIATVFIVSYAKTNGGAIAALIILTVVGTGALAGIYLECNWLFLPFFTAMQGITFCSSDFNDEATTWCIVVWNSFSSSRHTE